MTRPENTGAEQECCPKFHPEKWDEKTFKWKDKIFIKEKVPAFFHIPFAPMIAKKMKKMMNLITAADKLDHDKEEVLVLFHDPTPFRSEFYISVTGEVPGVINTAISGKFAAKVFEGSYNEIPKFIKVMRKYLAEKFPEAPVKNEDYYAHYAYCPNCEKKFGGNYTTFFVKVGEL